MDPHDGGQGPVLQPAGVLLWRDLRRVAAQVGAGVGQERSDGEEGHVVDLLL